VAVEVAVTFVVLKLPPAVAVFAFDPVTAVIGPSVQVAVGSVDVEATGKVDGQVHELVLTFGSVTVIEVSGTSPVFSTVNR
jgi:hypothetical protein